MRDHSTEKLNATAQSTIFFVCFITIQTMSYSDNTGHLCEFDIRAISDLSGVADKKTKWKSRLFKHMSEHFISVQRLFALEISRSDGETLIMPHFYIESSLSLNHLDSLSQHVVKQLAAASLLS